MRNIHYVPIPINHSSHKKQPKTTSSWHQAAQLSMYVFKCFIDPTTVSNRSHFSYPSYSRVHCTIPLDCFVRASSTSANWNSGTWNLSSNYSLVKQKLIRFDKYFPIWREGIFAEAVDLIRVWHMKSESFSLARGDTRECIANIHYHD